MNRAEKQALAQMLITHAADLIEDWQEQLDSSPQGDVLRNVDGREIAQTLANWLQHLPGEGWDARLPEPAPVNKRKVGKMRPGDGRATRAVMRNLCKDVGNFTEAWESMMSQNTTFAQFVDSAQRWLRDKSELSGDSIDMANWKKVYNYFREQFDEESEKWARDKEPTIDPKEQEIRAKIAQELLSAMEKSGQPLKAGLWYAAILVDPSVNTFTQED